MERSEHTSLKFYLLLAATILISYFSVTFLLELRLADLIQRYKTYPNDFLAFWSGFQVFVSGGNSYSLSELEVFQKQVHPSLNSTQFFLSPPWLLILLSPVLMLDFGVAKNVWFFLNIGLVLGVIFTSIKLFSLQILRKEFLLLSATSIPVVICLLFGQLSLAVTLALLLCLYAVEHRRDWLAAICIPIVLLKPHISFLVLLAIAINLLVQRRFKTVTTMVGVSLLFIALPMAFRPQIYQEWIEARHLAENNVTSTLFSFTSFVAMSLNENLAFLFSSTLFKYAPSILAILGFLTFAITSKNPISSLQSFPLLIVTSLIFAPYAWFYDFVLLLPIGLLCLSRFSQSRFSVSAYLLVLHLAVLLQMLYAPNLAGLFWYPFLVLYLFLIARRKRISL